MKQILGLFAIVLSSSLEAQNPRDVVARAVQTMGGEAAVRGLRTVSADYHAITYGMGQSETAESPPRVAVVAGRVVTDVAGGRRYRVTEIRPFGAQVGRSRRVTAGGISMLETPTGQLNPDPAGTVVALERAMRRDPEKLLIAALDHPGALSALPARAIRGDQHDGVHYAFGPDTLDLYFDRASGLLTATETLTDDPILGDRRTTAMYTRWQAAGGTVRLPRQVDVSVNGQPLEHWAFLSMTTDAPVGDTLFAIPDSIAGRAPRSTSFTPAPIVVTMVELAPGQWRAEGSTHHSLIIEQPDQIVILEAPQSSARMQAVLDTVRARFPSKRIGLVVNTHHHWDHSGGLRAVINAGIPIVTHARNVAFIRRIAAAPKTVQPDEQARRRRQPVVRAAGEITAFGEGASQVFLFEIPTVHVEGILAAYLPASRILFTADVLNPAPTLSQSGSAELVAFARARNLSPARYAGAHGVVLEWPAVERAAAGAR